LNIICYALKRGGNIMNDCLILVDLQNDYFPGGKMELVNIEKAAENAQFLMNEFRKNDLPIVHIQHHATDLDATFFLPGTNGVKTNKMVAPHEKETVVAKNYPNSFRETSLMEVLQKEAINNLIICGAMSHMCIDATTRAAFDFGFNCIVAEDACATKDLVFKDKTIEASEVHESFMAALSGTYAKVLSTKELIENMA